MAGIGIDVDDVLADSLPRLLAAFRQHFGLEVELANAGWDVFGRFPQVTREERRSFFARLESNGFLEALPLVAGAAEGVRALRATGHRLFAVTGRPDRLAPQTHRWLENVGLLACFEAVHLRGDEAIPDYKRRLAEALRLDALVDDEPEVAVAVGAGRTRVLLFDRAWNRVSLPAQILRVHSWADVVAAIEALDVDRRATGTP